MNPQLLQQLMASQHQHTGGAPPQGLVAPFSAMQHLQISAMQQKLLQNYPQQFNLHHLQQHAAHQVPTQAHAAQQPQQAAHQTQQQHQHQHQQQGGPTSPHPPHHQQTHQQQAAQQGQQHGQLAARQHQQHNPQAQQQQQHLPNPNIMTNNAVQYKQMLIARQLQQSQAQHLQLQQQHQQQATTQGRGSGPPTTTPNTQQQHMVARQFQQQSQQPSQQQQQQTHPLVTHQPIVPNSAAVGGTQTQQQQPHPLNVHVSPQSAVQQQPQQQQQTVGVTQPHQMASQQQPQGANGNILQQQQHAHSQHAQHAQPHQQEQQQAPVGQIGQQQSQPQQVQQQLGQSQQQQNAQQQPAGQPKLPDELARAKISHIKDRDAALFPIWWKQFEHLQDMVRQLTPYHIFDSRAVQGMHDDEAKQRDYNDWKAWNEQRSKFLNEYGEAGDALYQEYQDIAMEDLDVDVPEEDVMLLEGLLLNDERSEIAQLQNRFQAKKIQQQAQHTQQIHFQVHQQRSSPTQEATVNGHGGYFPYAAALVN